MTSKFTVFTMLALVAASLAQAPTPPNSAGNVTVAQGSPATATIPLTDHETAQYRSAQIRVVKAQIAIAADPLWKELQAAQAELNSLPAQFITGHKLDAGTHGLCDGPVKGEHACDGLVAGQLGIGTLTPVPAAPVVKK
jgi:hypothetical protein